MAQLDDLQALRDLLWQSLLAADPDKRAALSAQYRGTLAEIEKLDNESSKAGDSIDEIAARRAARGGATARPGQATRGAG